MTDMELDKQVRETVSEINKTAQVITKPKPNEPPEYRFVAIGDNVIEAILETAKAQLNKAENNYKMAQQIAEDVRDRIKRVWELLQESEKELEDYGHYTLDMNEKIRRKSNGPIQPQSTERRVSNNEIR